MMRQYQNCYRCNDSIERPIEKNGVYIQAPDVFTTESVEVTHAIVPTEETKGQIQSLKGEHYPDTPVDEIERALVSGTNITDYLGDPDDSPASEVSSTAPAISEYERVEITDVSEAPEESVKVETSIESRDVPKSAIVCRSCHDPETDTVIW